MVGVGVAVGVRGLDWGCELGWRAPFGVQVKEGVYLGLGLGFGFELRWREWEWEWVEAEMLGSGVGMVSGLRCGAEVVLATKGL